MYNIIETKKIGKNLIVENFVIIKENVSLGDNVIISNHSVIGTNAFITQKDYLQHCFDIKIGSNVYIGAFVNIAFGATKCTIIEDDVIINSYVLIAEDCHVYKGVSLAPGVKVGGYASIGENTSVGLGAVIRNRIKIGSNSIIGMGSVVVKDIPDGVIAYGNPCVVHDKNILPVKVVRKIVRGVKRIF
jgi:UDP-3-O-[3-hydroxymyristoyl] glucosamine N-acyltransferase